MPMAGKDQPVDWFFAFKFNSATFPGCTDDGVTPVVGSEGIFGGTFQIYKNGHSQQYVFATSENPTLKKGEACLGATLNDPLGATFAQVYLTDEFNYMIWNDQFYSDPPQFPKFQDKPWGHSKGMLAWNEDGEGFVLQVSTPSWPASGSKENPRMTDGNTLGCIKDDDVEVSQHFFCLKINKSDLTIILNALINASVVTGQDIPQIVKNGGPADIQALVKLVGKVSKSRTFTAETLSSGVQILSKPSAIASPVWQLVSAQLGSIPLRVATWWEEPAVFSTDENTPISCWPDDMNKPGAVEIATSGIWDGTSLGFLGGAHPTRNHAKIGVSKDPMKPISIFGDMNQQGTLNPISEKSGEPETCVISQNARGGLFYVVNNQQLFESVSALLSGDSAPMAGKVTPSENAVPVKKKKKNNMKDNQQDIFLSISASLTGFSETDLHGTGMIETYYNTFLEKGSPEDISNFFLEVNEVFNPANDTEEKINKQIDKHLFNTNSADLTKNLITMWYTGNWGQDVISPESYVQGLIWNAAQTHPPGAKQPGFGSWAEKPFEIPTN